MTWYKSNSSVASVYLNDDHPTWKITTYNRDGPNVQGKWNLWLRGHLRGQASTLNDATALHYVLQHNPMETPTMNPTTSQFWIIFNNTQEGPYPKATRKLYRHSSEYQARQEAERLAKQSPGQEFIVMSSVCAVETNNVTVKEYT
mgnify:CR=1 FL=1